MSLKNKMLISQIKMAPKSKNEEHVEDNVDNEDIRDKTFSLIEKVLANSKLPKDTACKIEEGIEKNSRSENGDFSVMLYTILTVKVLQNIKSKYVIENIKTGTWQPEDIAGFDKDTLNPEKWQQIQENRLPKNIKKEKKKGLNKCKRCQSWYVEAFSMQTRSADESCTIFCECSDCGNRWKIN